MYVVTANSIRRYTVLHLLKYAKKNLLDTGSIEEQWVSGKLSNRETAKQLCDVINSSFPDSTQLFYGLERR